MNILDKVVLRGEPGYELEANEAEIKRKREQALREADELDRRFAEEAEAAVARLQSAPVSFPNSSEPGQRGKLLNDLQEAKVQVQQWKSDISEAKLKHKEKIQALELELAAHMRILKTQLSYAESSLLVAREAYMKGCCVSKRAELPPLPVRQALLDGIRVFTEHKGYRSYQRICDEAGIPCSGLADWNRMTAGLVQDPDRFESAPQRLMTEDEILAIIKNIILTTIQ